MKPENARFQCFQCQGRLDMLVTQHSQYLCCQGLAEIFQNSTSPGRRSIKSKSSLKEEARSLCKLYGLEIFFPNYSYKGKFLLFSVARIGNLFGLGQFFNYSLSNYLYHIKDDYNFIETIFFQSSQMEWTQQILKVSCNSKILFPAWIVLFYTVSLKV